MKASQLFVALTLSILASCATGKRDRAVAEDRSAPHLATTASPAKGKDRTEVFLVGSTATEVKSVMGLPDDVRERDGGKMEVWTYRFSTVSFRNGRVFQWADHSKNLKARGDGDSGIAKQESLSRGLDSDDADMSPELAASVSSRRQGALSGSTNPSVQYVDQHQRSDGSSVGGYFRTTPDASRTNNFTSRGNVNPRTGQRGSR